LVFAEIQDHGRRRDDSSGVSEPRAASRARLRGLRLRDTDALEKLAKLHEEGALTDEEFTAGKNRILGL
jgi:hypothetical protein